MISRKGAKTQSWEKKSDVMLRNLFQCLWLGLLITINSAFAAQVKPAWQLEWEKTLDGAKKEGQVVVYISGYEAILQISRKNFLRSKLSRSREEEINLDRVCWRNGARKNLSLTFPAPGRIPTTNSFTSPRRSIQSSRR